MPNHHHLHRLLPFLHAVSHLASPRGPRGRAREWGRSGMGAMSAAGGSWAAEDDVPLKNAVEVKPHPFPHSDLLFIIIYSDRLEAHLRRCAIRYPVHHAAAGVPVPAIVARVAAASWADNRWEDVVGEWKYGGVVIYSTVHEHQELQGVDSRSNERVRRSGLVFLVTYRYITMVQANTVEAGLEG
uniref:Uncharacterized protein n=1 Tax=Oryza brachyantha TaxID=4533 RepID=J3LPH2_ORYBR